MKFEAEISVAWMECRLILILNDVASRKNIIRNLLILLPDNISSKIRDAEEMQIKQGRTPE
jgi:hypothetical protein